MLCQNETGVLSGSELFFNTVDAVTRRLFFYINCCGHYHCERGYKVRRNHMDSLLLIFIEQGSFFVEYQNRAYTAQAGDILLMDGTVPQYYGTHDYAEFYWMHIAGSNAFELYDHLTRLHGGILHRLTYQAETAVLIRYLVSQFKNNQVISASGHSCMLYRILCSLAAQIQQPHAGKTGPVQQTIDFIEEHLGEDLNLKRLAAEVHISPPHLIRLFRKETGRSPHEYIVLARMDRAKYLLKTSDLPVKTIASAVGYQTESSFTGTFTEKIGISPRRFREFPLG
ncbi:MAG: helix-turn-helix domain-containing protein [Butyricicoccus sp.]|nr:helix-turn-helix domain-containing protein [Butyricicoccus sp.]